MKLSNKEVEVLIEQQGIALANEDYQTAADIEAILDRNFL